jgi:hypothetical protein
MFRKMIGILSLSLAVATVAQATAPTLPTCVPGGPSACIKAAPEIDPATAMAGLTLLLGGLAVARGRITKKKQD